MQCVRQHLEDEIKKKEAKDKCQQKEAMDIDKCYKTTAKYQKKVKQEQQNGTQQIIHYKLGTSADKIKAKLLTIIRPRSNSDELKQQDKLEEQKLE